MKFTIVAAECGGIIGADEKIPWKHSGDLKLFKTITSQTEVGKKNILIVGRKTYVGMPKLDNAQRTVVVLTRDHIPGVITFPSFRESLEFCHCVQNCNRVFVIGGGQLYSEAIVHPMCNEIILSSIPSHYLGTSGHEGVVYFPQIPKWFRLSTEVLYTDMTLRTYMSEWDYSSEERGYLDVMKNILTGGIEKEDRTGVGTISLFGQTLQFDLSRGFPLLTTKKMFLRGIIAELLFFLRGQIDNDILVEQNVHIWDGNTTREFLDSRGMHGFETGSLGKAYGFQWRHWGAEYRGKNHDYTGEGHDQIADILHKLRNDPNSRRIVLNAWNVSDLKEMCLEPCHTMYVFSVRNGKLYCHLTQRSGDMFLGVPFNIASTALLTTILAQASGLIPGGIMMTIVDAHIYKNHIDQTREQLTRMPYKFPTLTISPFDSIENLTPSHFVLSSYTSHPPISAKMAV